MSTIKRTLVISAETKSAQQAVDDLTEQLEIQDKVILKLNLFLFKYIILNMKINFDNETNKVQKEKMFIQMLEGLHQDEAQVLMGMKNKTLNKMYKGLTESVVKEAFGWNDKFVRPEPEQK